MKQIQNISLNPCAALRVAAALFLALGMITTQAETPETPKKMFEDKNSVLILGTTRSFAVILFFCMAKEKLLLDENHEKQKKNDQFIKENFA